MTIDPLLPVWIILAMLGCLLAWSLVIEWRRPLRYRLLRMLACGIAVLSLAAIFLRPGKEAQSRRKVVLLTASGSHAVVDSLLRARPGTTLYYLGDSGYTRSTKLASYRDLFRTTGLQSSTERLADHIDAIVGDGLPAYALDSLSAGFHYYSSRLPQGITGLSLPVQKLRPNFPTSISGTFRLLNTPATLYLSGPGGKSDSIELKNETGRFSFTLTPRVSGRITYTLALVDRTGTRMEERFPLVVAPKTPLNILILQDYPTFELQHLKTFLSDRGHRIAARMQLSRNTYRTEFINRTSMPLTKVSPILLDAFDVVIADPEVLTKLTATERSALERALRDGLGMIVALNGIPAKYPGQSLLPVTFSAISTDTTSVRLAGKRIALPATRLKPAAFEGAALLRDQSRVLAGYTPVRKGIVGFQLLRETYSLLLAGDSASYGLLWSPLIDAAARPSERHGQIRIVSQFPPLINEPLSIEIISGATPALFADSVRVSAGEDVLIDGLWHATIWPDDEGWHELRTQTDTLSYYTFTDNDWRTMRLTNQQHANRTAASRPSAARALVTQTPISPTAFWIAFLLSAGFLWLAPKL